MEGKAAGHPGMTGASRRVAGGDGFIPDMRAHLRAGPASRIRPRSVEDDSSYRDHWCLRPQNSSTPERAGANGEEDRS